MVRLMGRDHASNASSTPFEEGGLVSHHIFFAAYWSTSHLFSLSCLLFTFPIIVLRVTFCFKPKVAFQCLRDRIHVLHTIESLLNFSNSDQEQSLKSSIRPLMVWGV